MERSKICPIHDPRHPAFHGTSDPNILVRANMREYAANPRPDRCQHGVYKFKTAEVNDFCCICVGEPCHPLD